MTQDIYSQRQKPRDVWANPPGGGRGARPQHMWAALQRRQLIQNIVSLVLVLLIIGLVVVVSLQHQLLSSPPAPRDSEGMPFTGRPRFLGLDPDPRGDYIIQTYEQPEDLDIGEGDKPLDRYWVRQAAYHLLQAEQAEREGMNQRALEEYGRALRIYPELRGVQSRVGVIHMEQPDHEAAIRAFELALQEEPDAIGVLNNLAVAYLRTQRFDQAEEVFMRVIELQPQYAAAHYNLASLLMDQEKLARATTYFESYQKLAPTDLNAALAHAATLIKLEDWAGAVRQLSLAAELSPGTPPILFRLAQCHAHAGQTEQALEALRRGIALVDAARALVWMSRSEFDPIRHEPQFQQWIDELADRQR
jgi:tetratricopeptide (TPR) repeat protein